MTLGPQKFSKKTLGIAIVICVSVLAYFWIFSRYPSLNNKAFMGQKFSISESLSFDTIYRVEKSFPFYKRIFYTTVNWSYTNMKGMTFGLLFASCFLVIINILGLKRYQTKNKFLGSLIGLFIGTPLGVCVNCVTPIGKSMQKGGMNEETVLGTVHSSPTLNIVVLSMLFSMFPFYFGALKIAFTLFHILIIVPILCYVFLPKSQKVESQKISWDEQSWKEAFVSYNLLLAKSLRFIILTTLPLMLLTGLVGSIFIELIPLNQFIGKDFNLLTGLSLAALGLVLPVPIAFDIIFASLLMRFGLHPNYVMILLFSLGIISFYPISIFWKTYPKKFMLSLITIIFLESISVGLISQTFHKGEIDYFLETFNNEIDFDKNYKTLLYEKNRPKYQSASPDDKKKFDLIKKSDSFTIYQSDLKERKVSEDNTFIRIEGENIGLYGSIFTSSDHHDPFSYGHGIGAGDFDQDDDIDLIIGTSNGPYLYENKNGKFNLIRLPSQLMNKNTFIVGFVDINNDGFLDIYTTTYKDGSYFSINKNGSFQNFQRIPTHPDTVLTLATSFADIDKDGDLDFIQGNWSFGDANLFNPIFSKNYLYINEGELKFEVYDLAQEMIGETLSTLFSDFNHDGNMDLFIANDVLVPDQVYLGDGKGQFKKVLKSQELIPLTSHNSMSIASGDYNNDGRLDLFTTDMPKEDVINDYACNEINGKYKYICDQNYKGRSFVDSEDHKSCTTLDTPFKEFCLYGLLGQYAIFYASLDLCEKIPSYMHDYKINCNLIVKNYQEETHHPNENLESLDQEQINVLLNNNGDTFLDVSQKMQVTQSSWSWNAKFNDFDSDGFEDLYVGNGYILIDHAPKVSNVFYHNQKGLGFVKSEDKFGLTSFFPTPSYVSSDFDGDGDLDLITISVNGPIYYFSSQTSNNSVIFEIKDFSGNKFGIGTKLFFKSSHGSVVKEITSGGGFLSFDDYKVHLGLGKDTEFELEKIQWSSGDFEHIGLKLNSNKHYKIIRSKVIQ